MAIGTIAGAEGGAQLIQVLKRAGNVNRSSAGSPLLFIFASRHLCFGKAKKH